MMALDLDAHASPPAAIRRVYKRLQKLKDHEVQSGSIRENPAEHAIDSRCDSRSQPLGMLPDELQTIFEDFLRAHGSEHDDFEREHWALHQPRVYPVASIPGKW